MRADFGTDTLSDDAKQLAKRLSDHGIMLSIQRKAVKNINYRVKPGVLSVSAPLCLSDAQLIDAIAARIDWAVAAHRSFEARHDRPITLWGAHLDMDAWLDGCIVSEKTRHQLKQLDETAQLMWIYRHEIELRLPQMAQRCHEATGKQASQIRLRRMRSRWGSCNVRTSNITLNTHLAAYPECCLEYVLVHELCHLYHPNHSADFWASVKKAMPDYRQWHDFLKQKSLQI